MVRAICRFKYNFETQNIATQSMPEAVDEQAPNLAIFHEGGRLVLRPATFNKNKIVSIEWWTDAFFVYISIYLEANSIRSYEPLKYGQLIRSAAARYYGYGWRDYDIEFRHRMHRKGGLWSLIDGELWLLHVIGWGSPRNMRIQDRPQTQYGSWAIKREWATPRGRAQ